MELLSPAGNYKAFVGAVNAGCDAVYLGGTKFGARAYADNFNDEEIIRAITLAHIYGVKVYLTVNTLIKEREFKEVLNYIKPFYEAGLDGCIVQDLGLISVFGRYFPNMECHISTQGFATGIESVKYYKSLGASRVVLARELSLDEIKKIKESVDVELETFIHGAMCYSYSGNCLFSSCLGARSGNRGRCAGPCRLPYSVTNENGKTKEGYLLSMKDQCTLEILPSLIEAGIDSLKIEGRMKKPEYSAFVTAIYRKYIDLYKKDPSHYKVDKIDLDNLRHIYLRSEIGDGYYKKQNGREMISVENPGYSGNDEALMKKIEEDYLLDIRRKPVDIFVSCFSGAGLFINVSCEGHEVSFEGPVVEESLNHPLKEEDIKKQISKLGDTCFSLNDLHIEMGENCFVSLKAINEARRNSVKELENSFLNKSLKDNIFSEKSPVRKKNKLDKALVLVRNSEQYKAVCSFCDVCIPCVPSDMFLKGNFCEEIVVSLPDIVRIKDRNYVDKVINKAIDCKVSGIIVHNMESLSILRDSAFKGVVIASSEVYCFNNESVNRILMDCDSYILPLELSKHELLELDLSDAYMNVYGKIPLMHTANCVLKTAFGCEKDKGKPFIKIFDRTNTAFSVLRNCDVCSNTIFNSVPTVLLSEAQSVDFPSERFFISLTDEGKNETENILNLYFGNKGEMPSKYTKAYWKRGVE